MLRKAPVKTTSQWDKPPIVDKGVMQTIDELLDTLGQKQEVAEVDVFMDAFTKEFSKEKEEKRLPVPEKKGIVAESVGSLSVLSRVQYFDKLAKAQISKELPAPSTSPTVQRAPMAPIKKTAPLKLLFAKVEPSQKKKAAVVMERRLLGR